MKLNMRKAISFILTLMLVVSVMPTTFAIGVSDTVEINRMNSGVVIDDDATGGYEGDYVVIYNPGTSTSSSVSTGTLTGLIETSVGTSAQMKGASKIDADRPYIIDVDGEFGYEDITKIRDNPVKASYPVGTTKNFSITNYSPGGSSVQFKVLYVGEHCRIWTVTNESYYPLDTMNKSYAETVAAEFDKNFTRMSDSFGAFRDSNSDGKVNLMFYNIDDGWQPGQGYVAGYFWSGDFSYNSLPMIHIDTYPGIQYTTTSGETREDVTSCYGTFMHEFQHLINYSVTGGMDTWLNESFSGATEEMFYPGVGLFNRIQSWHDSHFSAVADISNVASEFEYNSSYNLHKGGSIYTWDNNGDDIYARYAIVMLFSQYLYTQTGGTTVYKTIMNSVKNGSSCTTAIANAMGTTIANVAKGFFTSMIANDGGENGFIMQPGYDPTTVYNVENVYDLLAPVVFTGTSASIYGGGFITVKPVNGVFNPPSGASSTLKYVGIKLNNEPIAVTAISIPDTAEVAEGAAASIALTITPSNANDYTTAWSSDNTAIATVDSNGKVTGIATGTTTITCTVTDNVSGSTFTDTCTVTVTAFEGYLVADQFEDGGEYIIVATDAYAVSNNTV
ncbi:MAG: Ig-like domain-containing protein, partial [Clostridiales bacterium]|nr:Ig-like domain-containing protein [Clostridiales bacterium]